MGRWANKYVIGLTGNIAMGKSLVRKMLENLGAYTIDADGLAHQAMTPGAPSYAPVIEWFGKWILDDQKRIDRNRLGSVAFAHNAALNQLELLTHPVVGQALDILINRAKRPIVVIEAIKLVDGALADQVDAVWVVTSTPENQLSRLITKRGMTDWEARKRIETQNPQQEKLEKANVVITNNGGAEEVWTQVQRAWDKIPVRKTGTLQAPAPQTIAPPAPVQPPPRQPPAPSPPVQVVPTWTPPPIVTPPPPPPPDPATIQVRAGMPRDAESIAKMLSDTLGKAVTRNDIMLAFGEKSYLLAGSGSMIVGLAGFQVENLITRTDEFMVNANVPLDATARMLISAVEERSADLQSEVSFAFMARNTPANVLQPFLDAGYERIEPDALKIPAWREAAAEAQAADKQILMRKLRDRILTPI